MSGLVRLDARQTDGDEVDRAYRERVNWLRVETVPPPPGVLPTE